jgi:hypothetical protein
MLHPLLHWLSLVHLQRAFEDVSGDPDLLPSFGLGAEPYYLDPVPEVVDKHTYPVGFVVGSKLGLKFGAGLVVMANNNASAPEVHVGHRLVAVANGENEQPAYVSGSAEFKKELQTNAAGAKVTLYFRREIRLFFSSHWEEQANDGDCSVGCSAVADIRLADAVIYVPYLMRRAKLTKLRAHLHALASTSQFLRKMLIADQFEADSHMKSTCGVTVDCLWPLPYSTDDPAAEFAVDATHSYHIDSRDGQNLPGCYPEVGDFRLSPPEYEFAGGDDRRPEQPTAIVFGGGRGGWRVGYFDEMRRAGLEVVVAGQLPANQVAGVGCPEYSLATRQQQKACLGSRYQFVLAVENSFDSGYVTEKLYQALATSSVVAYTGPVDAAASFFPVEECAVDLSQFGRDGYEAGLHLIAVLANASWYEHIRAWRGRPLRPQFEQTQKQCMQLHDAHLPCKYCRWLEQRRGEAQCTAP